MPRDIVSKRTLGILGVVALMLIAGCFQPPSPPNSNTATPTPTPAPYESDPARLNFEKVHNDSTNAIKNEVKGVYVKYSVNVKDPRLDGGTKTFNKTYRINTRTGKYFYNSTFKEEPHAIYHDSVLFYEKMGDKTTVQQIGSVEESKLITAEQVAAENLLGVKTGINTVSYTLSNVQYKNGSEVSTYTASTSVQNYALEDFVPTQMNYQFGNPQMKDESISSKLVIHKNGLMTKYTFTYESKIFVGGKPKTYKYQITYTVIQSGPNLPVDKPAWTQSAK